MFVLVFPTSGELLLFIYTELPELLRRKQNQRKGTEQIKQCRECPRRIAQSSPIKTKEKKIKPRNPIRTKKKNLEALKNGKRKEPQKAKNPIRGVEIALPTSHENHKSRTRSVASPEQRDIV
jgi:hypothetical protein